MHVERRDCVLSCSQGMWNCKRSAGMSGRRLFLSVLLFSVATVSAWAHAFLDHAEPRVGEQIRAAPSKVKIWFTERVEPALSRIEVFDSAGKEVDRRDSRVNSTNPAIVEVSLAPLQPGKYKASWRVTAVDTHMTTGTFEFEVVR
jgi:copper resistance protein C